MLAFALGVPSFFCVTVFLSDSKKPAWLKATVYGLVALIIFLIYLYLPDSKQTLNTSIPYIRYGMYNAIAHLFVAFIPYVQKRHLNGFWNYNKGLFLRLVLSLFYSMCLYLGIALAYFALEELFGIDIDGETYGQTWFTILGIFNTWFFVAGIPKDLNQLNEITVYPKGLRIFTQYVLLPLLILYLIILYGYGGKILIEGDWPKGIVSYLISGISVFGIFTMLLIYPFRVEKDKGWIGKFSTWYYYLLFPLALMLFIAVGIRISDYGITINRYVLVILGIWLTIISIYFSIGRSNIKVIPMLLASFLALMSFGPWGMFSVSERSQVKRLETILTEYGILKDGKVQNEVIWIQDSLPQYETQRPKTNIGIMPDSVHNEVYSIMDYLDDNHGFENIRDWFSQDLQQYAKIHKDSFRYSSENGLYMKSLGIPDYHIYPNDIESYNYFGGYYRLLSLDGYDYLLMNQNLRFRKKWDSDIKEYSGSRFYDSSKFMFNGLQHSIKLDSASLNLVLRSPQDTIVFPFYQLKNRIVEKYKLKGSTSDIPPEEMNLVGSSENLRVKLLIKQFRLEDVTDTDTTQIDEIDFHVLLKSLNE
tara:strand:- start:4830 stop:6599 length:1770 start_codon:yes stop_codon:yes gene_type:complete